jgi:uncharacterized protein with GYD domain
MSEYLVLGSLSGGAAGPSASEWSPPDELLHAAATAVGGTLSDRWLTLGAYDIVGVVEIETPVKAAAMVLALNAQGLLDVTMLTAVGTDGQGIAETVEGYLKGGDISGGDAGVG